MIIIKMNHDEKLISFFDENLFRFSISGRFDGINSSKGIFLEGARVLCTISVDVSEGFALTL